MARISQLAAVAFADGSYLCRWPKLAAFGPPVCLVFGLIAGWTHFSSGETFTFSLPLMAIMTVIASFGAGLGTWCWLGYVAGDLLLYQLWHVNNDLFLRLSAALLSYVLLSLLLILIPITSENIRRRALSRVSAALKDRMVRELASSVAQGVIQGLLILIWVNAVPTLIRPAYTWLSMSPPVPAIRPLQENGDVLIALGGVFGVVRQFLQFYALRQSAVAGIAWNLQQVLHRARSTVTWPAWMNPLLTSAFSVFLLSGLLESWLDAFILLVVFFGLNVARQMLVGKLPQWGAIVFKIPWLLRFPAALLVSYGISWAIIGGMWSSTYTFRPVVISVVLSCIVFALLFPLPLKQHRAAKAGAS